MKNRFFTQRVVSARCLPQSRFMRNKAKVNEVYLAEMRIYMSEQKKMINFTVACVNEFARKHDLSVREAFQYLFQYKGIEFIKENYESEHVLSFDTILEDIGILCKRNGGML